MASAGTALITGGAGFIGSHLADAMIADGWRVRILDNLDRQVHGPEQQQPEYLNKAAELIVGDVTDRAAVGAALEGVDTVVHLAARVGVGQSMYEIAEYYRTNCVGTGILLEALPDRPVRRLVVASSMSIYGEGLYRRAVDVEGARDFKNGCGGGLSKDRHARENGNIGLESRSTKEEDIGLESRSTKEEDIGLESRSTKDMAPGERSAEALRRREWEPVDDSGWRLEPIPTPERKRPSLSSIYALTKFDQEQMCLMFGKAYGLPTVALRFFNVYGTRQALSNPYTGVLAIFASRLLNGKPPLIFEDGLQRRDFVSVRDVVQACRLALSSDEAVGHAINIGSGRSMSVREIAAALAAATGSGIEPRVTQRFRAGDIRHCFADIELARRLLGYSPRVSLEDGLAELADWLRGQAAVDQVDAAHHELEVRGLSA